MSETLIASGDQAMVQLGIQIQRDAIADMLSGRMIASMANQTAAYERLGKDVDYTQVGTALRINLEQIYTDGRNQETLLWEGVDRSIQIEAQNLVTEYDRLKDEFLLDTEDMPAFLTNWINKRKKALGLLPPEPSAGVVAAQKKVDNLSPVDVQAYESFKADFIKSPDEYLRIRGVSPEVRKIVQDMSEGVDYDNFPNLADELVSVAVDALSRRRGLGKTQSAEYRGILKVANANSELFKQRALQDTVPIDPDDFDTAQDIAKFRSRMLTLAREAAGDPNRATEAKMYGEMAAAALRDLDAGLDVGANKAYDAARAFSFGFNEGIRRTFIGDAVGVNRFGADLTTPELLDPQNILRGNLRRCTPHGSNY